MFGNPVPVCSVNRLRWDLSPGQISQLANELITDTKKVYDGVAALDLDGVTFENTLKALADVEVEYTGEQARARRPSRSLGGGQIPHQTLGPDLNKGVRHHDAAVEMRNHRE